MNNPEKITIVGYGLISTGRHPVWGIYFVEPSERHKVKYKNIAVWGKNLTISHHHGTALIGAGLPDQKKHLLSMQVACYLIDLLERLPVRLVQDLARISNFDQLLNQDDCWKAGWTQYKAHCDKMGTNTVEIVAYKQLWSESDWRKHMVTDFLDQFHPVLTRGFWLDCPTNNRHCLMKPTGPQAL